MSDPSIQAAASPVDIATRNGSGPKVSVIIPALNEEKLIERTLRAFPPELRRRHSIELIVSDGGSSDRTTMIAEAFADRVVVHRQLRRQTIAEGRNQGAAVARGEVLVFINADTVPADPPRFVAALVAVAERMGRSAGPVAFACPVAIAATERRWSDRIFHPLFNTYVRMLNGIGLGMGRGECQVICHRSFRAVGGYNDRMVAGEDFDLYKRLRSRGRIGHSGALMVHESPRRFRRYGYLRVLAQWTMNGVSVMLRGRAVSDEWEQIR